MNYSLQMPISVLILILTFLIGCKPKPTERAQERKYSLERVGPARVGQVHANGFVSSRSHEANAGVFCVHPEREKDDDGEAWDVIETE